MLLTISKEFYNSVAFFPFILIYQLPYPIGLAQCHLRSKPYPSLGRCCPPQRLRVFFSFVLVIYAKAGSGEEPYVY